MFSASALGKDNEPRRELILFKFAPIVSLFEHCSLFSRSTIKVLMKFAVAKLINLKAIGVLFCPMMSKNDDANSFLILPGDKF